MFVGCCEVGIIWAATWIHEEWPDKIQGVHSGYFMQIDFNSKGKKLKPTDHWNKKHENKSEKAQQHHPVQVVAVLQCTQR